MENPKPPVTEGCSTLTDEGEGERCRTIHLRVTGLVQGVYLRAWTAELAETLQLDGWVRNRPDGSVEALISGSADSVARMMSSIHQGPPHAQVTQVEILQEGGTAPSGFAILPTTQ